MKSEIDEAAVWQRVQAANGPSPDPLPDQNHGLTQALEAGRTLGECYGSLYRGGKSGFSALFEGQRQENQQLLGLYLLLHGTRPQLTPLEKPKNRTYPQLLRWLLCRQEEQQQRLTGLATVSGPNQAQLLTLLAEQARLRWSQLVEELGRCS